MTNGYNLFKIRQEKGLSQMQMAELLNTSQQQYSKYERGFQDLTGHKIIEYCKVLKVSPNELLGFENEYSTEERSD